MLNFLVWFMICLSVYNNYLHLTTKKKQQRNMKVTIATHLFFNFRVSGQGDGHWPARSTPLSAQRPNSWRTRWNWCVTINRTAVIWPWSHDLVMWPLKKTTQSGHALILFLYLSYIVFKHYLHTFVLDLFIEEWCFYPFPQLYNQRVLKGS